MFCTNCGNELKANDKFCNQCGKQTVSNDINSITNNNCTDHTYTTAQRENKAKTIIAFIICLSIVVLMLMVDRAFNVIPVVIGIGILVVLVGCTSKSFVGKCPYCDNLVKSNSATSFVCPYCRKNVMIKDNKFWKIKN